MRPERVKAIGSVAGMAVAITAVVFATLPSPAEAGPDPVYELDRTTLESGRSVVRRWNPCQEAITYGVNLSGLPGPERAAMLKQVHHGFGRLSAATGLTFRHTGDTSFVPREGNSAAAPAEIVVAVVPRSATDHFPSDNPQAIGIGVTYTRSWSEPAGEGVVVTRGAVVLDAAETRSLEAGFGKGKSQGNLILHELGHVAGLDHVSSGAELMRPELTSRAPEGFGRGDLNGLRQLGKEAGCIAVPSSVLISDLS